MSTDLIHFYSLLQEYLDSSRVLCTTCGTAGIDLPKSGEHQWRSRHLLLQQLLPTPISLVQVGRYTSPPDLLFSGSSIFIQFNYNMKSSARYCWLCSIISVNEIISCFRGTVTSIPIAFCRFYKGVWHFMLRCLCR